MSRNEILAGYRGWLYRVAYDMLPAGSSDVDDLAQEGYIAMWRAMDTHDPSRGSLPTWLTGAARLRMADVARGHGRAFGRPDSRHTGKSAEATVDVDEVRDLFDADDSLHDVLFAYYEGEVAAAIDRLSPAQRRYVIGRFWLGLDGSSRDPEIRKLLALVPEMKRGASLWNGTANQRGARERLAADLEHLRDLVVA